MKPIFRNCVLILASALTACSDGGGGGSQMTEDLAPTISAVGDTSLSANSSEVEVAFSVDDDMTAIASLSVSVSSDGPELFGDDAVTLDGDGAQRRLLLTPTPGQTGQALFTLVVTDGAAQTAETSFTVTVTPQQVMFSDIARAAFAADSNATPISINDKEFADNASEFNDLLGL